VIVRARDFEQPRQLRHGGVCKCAVLIRGAAVSCLRTKGVPDVACLMVTIVSNLTGTLGSVNAKGWRVGVEVIVGSTGQSS